MCPSARGMTTTHLPRETHTAQGLAGAQPYENPVRARINAWFFHGMDWYMHWKYAALKTRLFADLPPRVVELGAGAGANFRYLRPGTTVIAAEPNRHMHGQMRQRARRWGVQLSIVPSGIEGLALADDSVDAVMASLVLCTVADAEATVREVHRVLKPGGGSSASNMSPLRLGASSDDSSAWCTAPGAGSSRAATRTATRPQLCSALASATWPSSRSCGGARSCPCGRRLPPSARSSRTVHAGPTRATRVVRRARPARQARRV